MKPRTLLIAAGTLGVVAVTLLQMESWRSQGGTVHVFRATREVKPPATLRGAYQVVEMPANTYAPMSSQVPTRDLERWVSNTPVVRPVHVGETITFDALQKAADEGLRISQGMRAVGVDVQSAQAVGYLVRPGDYIDIIATIPDQDVAVTKHLLQAKRVLAVDQQYRLEDSAFLQHRTYSTVTLEVTPAEAELLEAYRPVVRTGFSLALRPRGELEQVKTPTFQVTQARKP
ncbi:MAG: Flp pilus assembly protein CpaB [Vicinamibacterales bacterium]